MTNLESTLAALRAAQCPEDVFGVTENPKAVWRRLLRACHPDLNRGETKTAEDCLERLAYWWTKYELRAEDGTYGQRRIIIDAAVHTKKSVYVDFELIAKGERFTVYKALNRLGYAVVKIANEPKQGPRLRRELQIIERLRKDDRGKRLHRGLPLPIDSFQLMEAKGVERFGVAYAWQGGLTSLADIMKAFPKGIDARDGVWMWKRALAVLGLAHAQRIVHGAMTPDHILLSLEDHGVLLVGWADWREETRGKPASLDLLTLAQHMSNLIKDPPVQLREVLHKCLNGKPSGRPQTAWDLLFEIDKLLEPMFGPRVFRKFEMPAPAGRR